MQKPMYANGGGFGGMGGRRESTGNLQRVLSKANRVPGPRQLFRSEADPRNWFLSSGRKEFNMQGKTRREQQAFQSIPQLPVQRVMEPAQDREYAINSKMSGIDA